MSEAYRFGLLGHNIGYSKSPDIYNAIATLNSMEISYELFDIPAPEIASFMGALQARNLTGLAVTIPHKEEIIKYLTRSGEVAGLLGSVNSIKITGSTYEGYNTDWHGLTYALGSYREQVEGGHAVIIGTGGSARATAYAVCADLRVREVTIVGRTPEPTKRLQQLCQSLGVTTHAVDRTEFQHIDGRYTLVVNCTPLGGWNQPNVDPIPAGLDWSKVGMYFDVNYNSDNSSVQKARSYGIVSLDGSRMLVGQAAKSFEIWTGKTIDIEQVYRTVFPSA